MSINRDVFVFLEQQNGKITNSSLELFTAARTIVDSTNGKIYGLIFGDDNTEAIREATACGADTVISVENAGLADYSTSAYTSGLCEIVKKYTPDVLMISASKNGKDLAPRLARRLATGITANCTELSADAETGLVSWNMPAPGGIMATILCEATRPQMGTICPGALRKPEPDYSRTSSLIREEIFLPDEDKVELLRHVLKDPGSGLDICSADIIVSGGHGMGSSENFELIYTLAKRLGAAVGASRAAVDCEWAKQENLIGQTGRLVRPKLYIACGISGALQHLVGIADAECIVAINNDPKAPIFAVADYAVVGDAPEILRALIDQLG